MVLPKHLMLPGDFHKKTSEKSQAEVGEASYGGKTLAEIKDRCEGKALRGALQTCQGNKTEAAKILGISIRSLYNKLKRYGLED